MITRNAESSLQSARPSKLGPMQYSESCAAFEASSRGKTTEDHAFRAAQRSPVRLAFIGFGAINRRVAELVGDAMSDQVQIVAIARRQSTKPALSPCDARLLRHPAELFDVQPDIVIEAASRGAVADWGEAALSVARTFIICSSSALTDQGLLMRFEATACAAGSHLVISPGAIAGTEALAAAGLSGFDRLTHTIVKPPAGWRGTAAETLINLDTLNRRASFFIGSAREAAERFPANANVSVVTALFSGHGLDATRVELVADPKSDTNRHLIEGIGRFGKIAIDVDNRPFAENPRSSQLAALAIAHLVKSEVAAVERERTWQARERATLRAGA